VTQGGALAITQRRFRFSSGLQGAEALFAPGSNSPMVPTVMVMTVLTVIVVTVFPSRYTPALRARMVRPSTPNRRTAAA
jgi:hypothetical protein